MTPLNSASVDAARTMMAGRAEGNLHNPSAIEAYHTLAHALLTYLPATHAFINQEAGCKWMEFGVNSTPPQQTPRARLWLE